MGGRQELEVLAALQVGCCHVEGIVAEMEKQGYEVPSEPSREARLEMLRSGCRFTFRGLAKC